MSGLPRLHLPTTSVLLARPDFLAIAARLPRARVALHLRGRETPAQQLTALARALAPEVWINDRADVACATGARGLHLPAAGLPVAAARALLPRGTLLGVSAHSAAEARAAHEAGADYVMLGPIWPTASHPGRPALGLAAIGGAAPARVIAIGGIGPGRAAEALAAGAVGVAVISAVWDQPDPASAVAAMLVSLESQAPIP